MPEEHTVSTFTWLILALHLWLSIPAMTAMTQIQQYYKMEEKAHLGTNCKPFFDVKNRFFPKSDGKLEENPIDDEDDSRLDEPNLETFDPEPSLEVVLRSCQLSISRLGVLQLPLLMNL
ncbi:hypothetical protein L208DRAFT_1416639 [Tricholoma matsutake]|nr:hypothetical protein L208DRAFT_1416639 [Tricholoma matsutake 945]